MKKTILWLLCVLLTLGPCAGALAESGNAILGFDDANPNGIRFSKSFVYGDTLYLLSRTALYTCQAGDDALTRYDYPTIDEDYPSDEYSIEYLIFAGSEGLFGVRLYTSIDDEYNFEEAVFGEVTLEDGDVVFDDGKSINWDDMVAYYGNSAMAADIKTIICIDDMAYMLFYGSSMERQVASLDLDRGRVTLLEDLPSPTYMIPYKDGKLLLETVEASGDSQVTFVTYDPEEEEVETLGSGQITGDKGLQAIAYDEETDTVYGVVQGQIYPVDPATCELGESVSSLPIAISEFGSSANMLPGSIYAYAEYGLALRDLNANHRPTSKLTIHDSVWASSTRKAYFSFMQTHDDVGAALTEEFMSNSNLVDDMMKQDDSIDIYVMSCNSTMYDAVRNRGYMLELDDCPDVQALADEMYPVLRDAMTYNGSIVAVPVRVSCGDITVNLKAMEALGLTLDDLPTSWEGMLDFLDALSEDWDEDGDVSIAGEFASDSDARELILLFMLMAYQRNIVASGENKGYNTDELYGLIDHLNNIDFEALGCEHQEDENEFIWPDEEKIPLIMFSGRNGALGSWTTDGYPLILSMMEGDTPYMVMECSVAFINPFTKNPDAARDYMDQLAQSLDPGVLYNLIPTLDEPVRDPAVTQKIADLEAKLESRKARLEDADDSDTQMIEDEIESIEAEIEDLQTDVWLISADQIEWFRAHDDALRVGSVDWLLNSEGGEAYDLLSQFMRGQIDAHTMLAGIDQKVQMRMMEGN